MYNINYSDSQQLQLQELNMLLLITMMFLLIYKKSILYVHVYITYITLFT